MFTTTNTSQLQHTMEMSFTVKKDSLLHKCPQLSRIAWN